MIQAVVSFTIINYPTDLTGIINLNTFAMKLGGAS